MRMRFVNWFRKHWIPISMALIVGFVAVLPQILAISALKDSYQGIHFLYIDDEDNYMAMVRDIVNGHWLAGSPEFFEYKNIKPIMLPFGAYLYAIPMMIFNIPIVWMMLAGKVIFPAVLFWLIYTLVKKMTFSTEQGPWELNAITTGFLATLGYELVDYGTVRQFLSGTIDYPLFSLWTRPVNPITGALLLYGFIIAVVALVETNKKYLIFVAAVVQASMVYYFFSWGVSLSLSAVLIIIFLARKKYQALKNIVYSLLVSILLLVPYWVIVWNSLGAGMGNETAARNGMFFTHAPIFNKVIILALIIFVPFFIKEWCAHKKLNTQLADWWWFCLSLLLASIWAFNQQILTGRTVWPHHFVQYTVGLCMVVIMVFVFNYFRPRFPKLWQWCAIILSVTILGYDIAIASTYRTRLEEFKTLQTYQPLFAWVNENTPKDCVILPTPSADETVTLITALTHCNTYISGQNFIIPEERIMHNLLVHLRLRNILPEKVAEYLYTNPMRVSTNFQPDWNQLFRPDTSAPWFVAAVDRVVKEYEVFYKNDFTKELGAYRLDYIVSSGDMDPELVKVLPGLRFVTKLDKMQIYEFSEK